MTLEEIIVTIIVGGAATVVLVKFWPRAARSGGSAAEPPEGTCAGGCTGCGQADACQVVKPDSQKKSDHIVK